MTAAVRFVSLAVCFVAFAGCGRRHLVAQSEQARGSFERTLTVTGPVELTVRTGSGDIQIRTGEGNRVQVLGRIRASESRRPRADPAERVRRVEAEPPIVQNGNMISIGETNGDELYNNVSISYELVVPANTQVSANTGSGNQAIGSVSGAVRARTGSGTSTSSAPAAASVAQTGSGNIRVASVGGEVRAQTGSGNVEVTQITKADVNVQTGSGNVTLPTAVRCGICARSQHRIGVDFNTAQPITMQGRIRRNHVEGTYGAAATCASQDGIGINRYPVKLKEFVGS